MSLSLLKLSPSSLFSPSPSVSVSVSLALLSLSDYRCLSRTPSVSCYELTVCPPVSPFSHSAEVKPPSFVLAAGTAEVAALAQGAPRLCPSVFLLLSSFS